MQPAAALGVGGLAISLLAIVNAQWRRALGGAAFAAAVAVMALAGQIVRWNLVELTPQTPAPRIIELLSNPFPNSVSFLIAGFALALICREQPSLNRLVVASIGAAVTAALGICSLLNQALRLMPALPAFDGEVSFDATLSLAFIGCGIILVAQTRLAAASESIGLFRPILVAFLGTVAAFVVWRALLEERTNMMAYQSATAANAMVRALRSECNQILRDVRYSANRSTPDLLEGALFPRESIRWTTQEAVRRRQHPQDQELLVLLSERLQGDPGFYAIHSGPRGAPEIAFAAPMEDGGVRLAVVPLTEIVGNIAGNIIGTNFQLFLTRGGRRIYAYPDPPRSSESTGLNEVPIPEFNGTLVLDPRAPFIKRGASWASHMVLAIGLNASFLLAFSAYLLNVARSRLADVQEIRSGLEREVAQRTHAQTELARKARQLEASNADLREFAYVTSHDLQEPLRSISGFAELLARRYKGKFDEDADEFLTYINESATRMSGMIQGLLTYSRVVHSAELDEVVPLAEAVEWAKSNLLLAIEESQARIVESELPVVSGNKLQFCQLLQNLISNAIKYRGPESPVIRISSELRDSEYVVTVADNGLGIGREFQDRVFGLFKRAHGRDYPGTGVGLALCKKIVERHGGRIWVESTPGQGSRFHFTLPAASS
jgi:signal transduction histidine kinase